MTVTAPPPAESRADSSTSSSSLLASRARQLAACFRRSWLHIALLASIGFAVRMPALSGELLWDDQYLALDSPFIKSPLLIFEVFRHHLFVDSFSGHYRPVQNLSFIFDYYFWNNETYGFHLTNVLLHVASGLLLYGLLRELLSSLRPSGGREESGPRFNLSLVAFLVALLWILHPVHSAAVDYISGRADSLAFMFACSAWLLFLRARTLRIASLRRLLYVVAAGSGLLAFCSRESACIWLGLFLLHLFLFQRGLSRRARLTTAGCCFILLAAYAGFRQLPEKRITAGPSMGWSFPVRTVLMLRALGDYGRLMMFPSNLHMERTVVDGGNYGDNDSWRRSVATEYLSVTGLALLAVLVTGSCRKGVGQSLRIFGAAWFVFGYLPISNISELNATVAEHWLYLPSVGFLLFLAGCVVDLPPRWHRLGTALACLMAIGLGARSTFRSTDWVTPETFYRRTMEAGGTSTRVAVNLGLIYSGRGEYARAESVFRRVLEVQPSYPIARNNLADVLYRQGKKEEAEALFADISRTANETRKEYPKTWVAALNMAHLRFAQADIPATLALLAKARADYPGIWEILSFQLEVVRQAQGPEASLALLDSFLRDNWWHYRAALARGRLLAEKGDIEKAEDALRLASWLDVHETEALNLLARIQVRQGRLKEAFQSQKRAVARQPHEPKQYLLLSEILKTLGRDGEADRAVLHIAQLRAAAQSQIAAK